MRRRSRLVVLVLLVAACGEEVPEGEQGGEAADTERGGVPAETEQPGDTVLTATLRDTAGTQVGRARFTARGDGVEVHVEVNGLPPGVHGVHIHETGQCDAAADTAFSTAGGHLNPTGRQHGLENPAGPHAGDLPNVQVGGDGRGTLEATAVQGVPDPVAALLDADGAALVVHANEDDQRTDDGPEGPGNSGGRLACGVVTR